MSERPKIPKLPKAVEDFADTVLRYRPKPKSEPAKKRRRRATKIAGCRHDWEQVNPRTIDGQRCMKCGLWR